MQIDPETQSPAQNKQSKASTIRHVLSGRVNFTRQHIAICGKLLCHKDEMQGVAPGTCTTRVIGKNTDDC